jgi:hypothetical protein
VSSKSGAYQLSFPYQYPKTIIFEFPLSIEDAMLFGDFSLSKNQAMQYIEKALTAIVGIGGVFALNIHPSRVKTQLWLVKVFLKRIKETNSTALITTSKFTIDDFSQDLFLNHSKNL